MVEVRQESALIDGDKVAYTAAGERGAPVVLVHGGASDRHDWAYSIPVLASRHRVYALDLVGYGESANPARVYTLRHLSEFLRGFIEALGLEPAHLVGHSLGARACLEVAGLAPEAVDRLVLIAPTGFGKMTLVGKLLVGLAWSWDRARLRPLPYPRLDIDADEPNIGSEGAVTAQTCLVWGKRDRYYPHGYGDRALEALPNARLRLFDNCGHAPHREAPEEFNHVLLEFLAPGR